MSAVVLAVAIRVFLICLAALILLGMPLWMLRMLRKRRGHRLESAGVILAGVGFELFGLGCLIQLADLVNVLNIRGLLYSGAGIAYVAITGLCMLGGIALTFPRIERHEP